MISIIKKANTTYYNMSRKAVGLRTIAASLFLMSALSLTLTGCVADNDANSKSIYDYIDDDVQSYGDLFDVFWSVMNQRYCDLNEQPGVSSLGWGQVYGEYKPKFDSLKTFLATSEFTQTEILADNAKAKQYFKEIVGKIIDQHFYVKVTLPVSHTSTETVQFRSSLRERGYSFPLNDRFGYAYGQLRQDGTAFCDNLPDEFCIVGGFMKDHPDTYYLGFSNFLICKDCNYTYKKEYLPTNAANRYHLDSQKIDSMANELVASQEKRAEVEREAAAVLGGIDQYFASDDVVALCKKMVAYGNDGDYYGLADCAKKASCGIPYALSGLPQTANVDDITSGISQQLSRDAECDNLCSEIKFNQWFCQALAEYLLHEREFYAYWGDFMFTLYYPSVENYRRYFLEPLKEGKINKLILDLRSNTGGYVRDTRYLTDYLVSHTATYCYFRKKENNNPYGYTPWVPQQIVVTSNSLNRDIPTAILIDNWSASMAEMTPLMLKSQGDHVKTIGRNSCGAQCMLFSENTANNGGWVGNVTKYLYFYMPVTMSKDAQGNLLEGVGITPDYPVDAMTDDEISKIKNAANDAKDRDMEKAIEVLQ